MSIWNSIVGMPSQFEVFWSSMGLGSLKSPFPCEHPRSFSISMGWDPWYHLTFVDIPKTVWSSMAMGNLISSYPCGQGKSIWNPIGQSGYHLAPVDMLSQSEIPQGIGTLISSYPCEHAKPNWISIVVVFFHIMLPVWTCQINKNFHGRGQLDIILHLRTPRANFEFHEGEMLISYYLCGHSMPTWSSTGVL
jgi:hypothetical protein